MKKSSKFQNDLLAGLAVMLLLAVIIIWEFVTKFNLWFSIPEEIRKAGLVVVATFLVLAFLGTMEDITAELPVTICEFFKGSKQEPYFDKDFGDENHI